MYRILFLTDLHLGQPDELPFGLDLRARFQKFMAIAPDYKPDLIVLGGDICAEHGDKQIYLFVYDKLKSSGIPFEAIAGNHDDSFLLAKTFNYALSGDSELFYERTQQGNRFLFLDSSSGRLSDDQWDWFESGIRNSPVAAIFMHHPPANVGIHYMDEHYPFEESYRMQELIEKINSHLLVVCGHYHSSKIYTKDNMQIFINPSLGIQIDQQSLEFKVEHTQAGFRILDFEDNRLVKTELIWF